MIFPIHGGGGAQKGAAPSSQNWLERLEDPTEPLFTIAVAADLLGTDHQTLRRLEAAIEFPGSRPSGNQRRYSRNDLARLSDACQLRAEGFSPATVARLLQRPR